MPIEQYTYWSMTINNPDENDYLIVRSPNSKYVRELVWTPEVGAEGTQHIQAWLRLQRNQTLAFVKKLYPRAHLKHCDKDVYNENCYQYAQKNDETTAGNHHITLHDPLPGSDTLLYQVIEKCYDIYFEEYGRHEQFPDKAWKTVHIKQMPFDDVERDMVRQRAGLEKIFISPAYEKMKARYWRDILYRLLKHKEDAGTDGIQTQTESIGTADAGTSDGDSYQESGTCQTEGSDQSSCSQADADDDW